MKTRRLIDQRKLQTLPHRSPRWAGTIAAAAIATALTVLPPHFSTFAAPSASPAAAPLDEKLQAEIKPATAEIDKGLAWLRTQQDPTNHSWEKDKNDPPAITAMVLKAFVQSGVDPDTDWLDKAADHVLAFQKESGGIYKDVLADYNTAIILSALSSAPEAEWQEPKAKALKYLRSLQWSDTIEGLPNNEQPVKKDDPRFGGWGYGSGKKGRPDMSNVSIALDALHDAGLKPSDEAYKNALEFVTRSQNNSETNNQPWAGSDGGFIYSPANDGMSAAGEYKDAQGKRLLRSYGSMTYAGLKSFIYCGLGHDDPRVKAAFGWVCKNWSLDQNPGLSENDPKTGLNGMYYYYHTLARALHAYGQPVITDAQGKEHDWRLELIAKLGSLQQSDGHWVGEAKWMENNPIICTTFAVLALQEAVTDLKEHPAK